ncbi:hypothetical protein ACXHP7_20230 [Vibrio chemaguriensis]
MYIDLKIDVKNAIMDPKGEEDELVDAPLFLYANGDVNWFATDYLMSTDVPKASKKIVKGSIRYFLEFLDEYEFWKNGNIQAQPVPLGVVTDEHLFDYVQYIEDDMGLNRNAIARRVKAALYFLKFIQSSYSLDYNLLAIADENGVYINGTGLVNAKWSTNSFRKTKFLDHDAIPQTESYSHRNPITEGAIDSLYDDLEKLNDEYTSELMSTLIDLLEATGARVSEVSNINIHTIELLRIQVEAVLKNGFISTDDVIRINKLTIDPKRLQAAEAIYRKAVVSQNSGRLVWLEIKTTKGKNKGKIRIVPIPFTTAQSTIKFFDEYIINEKDRLNKNLPLINRLKFNKLLIHPNSHLPMTGPMISAIFYEIFSRKHKSHHKRNPHLFRHRYITLLTFQQLKELKISMGSPNQLAGIILKRIQGLTGHASIETMLHYVGLADDMLQIENEGESSQEQFDDVVREHLVAKLGEEMVIELEEEIREKKAEKAIHTIFK